MLRAFAQSLWQHRRVMANPRYGLLGLFAFPYFLIFELLGPLVQLLAIPTTIGWLLVGGLTLRFALAFLVIALLLGMLLSLSALALEEISFHRHPRARDIVRLAAYSLLDNLGYRQMNDVWRVLALGDLVRRRRGWGEPRRRGFTPAG